MLVERITYEGPIRKRVTKFSHGGHIIVPGHWVGKEVRVTIIDDQQQVESDKDDVDMKRVNAKAVAGRVGGTYRNVPKGRKK